MKKRPKGCLLHLHIEDSINVEWISKIVNENKEKIYLRDFSKDIITRYSYSKFILKNQEKMIEI